MVCSDSPGQERENDRKSRTGRLTRGGEFPRSTVRRGRVQLPRSPLSRLHSGSLRGGMFFLRQHARYGRRDQLTPSGPCRCLLASVPRLAAAAAGDSRADERKQEVCAPRLRAGAPAARAAPVRLSENGSRFRRRGAARERARRSPPGEEEGARACLNARRSRAHWRQSIFQVTG